MRQNKCRDKSEIKNPRNKVQADLEKEVQREKALAEAEGRIREGRENEDVNRRTLQLRLQEEGKVWMQGIETTFRCMTFHPSACLVAMCSR